MIHPTSFIDDLCITSKYLKRRERNDRYWQRCCKDVSAEKTWCGNPESPVNKDWSRQIKFFEGVNIGFITTSKKQIHVA